MKTKKIIVYIMAMLCVASISGCGEKETTSEENSVTTEVTTTEAETTIDVEETTKPISTTQENNDFELDSEFNKNGISFLVSSEWEIYDDWGEEVSIDRNVNMISYGDDEGGLVFREQYVSDNSFGEDEKLTKYLYTRIKLEFEDTVSIENEQWIKIGDNLDCLKVKYEKRGNLRNFTECMFTNGNKTYLLSFPGLSDDCVDDIIKSISFDNVSA